MVLFTSSGLWTSKVYAWGVIIENSESRSQIDLLWVLLGIGALLLFFISTYFLLRRQIDRRTAELTQKNQELLQEAHERAQTVQALSDSQRTFSTLLSNLPGMAYRCQLGDRLAMNFVSEGCQDLTGYPVEAFLNQLEGDYLSLVHPDDRQPVLKLIRHAVEDKHPYQLTYRLHTASGEVKWVWEQGQAVSTNGGDTVSLEGLVMDITQRQRAEDIQSVLYNIASASISSTTIEELLTTVHHELARLLPVKNIFIALYDEETQSYTFPYVLDENASEAYPTGPLPCSLTEYVRRNDRPVLVDRTKHQELEAQGEVSVVGLPSAIWIGVPLRSPSRVIGVVALQDYHDPQHYTEKDLETLSVVSDSIAVAIEGKRAELVIARMAAVIDQASEAVAMADTEGKIIYINPYFEALTGYTPADLYGKQTIWDRIVRFEDETQSPILKALKAGDVWRGVVETRHKNSSIRTEDLTAFPIKDLSGNVISFATTSEDITEGQNRKRLLEVFARVATALRGAQGQAEIIEIVCTELQDLLLADGVVLTLFNSTQSVARVEHARGEWKDRLGEVIPMENEVLAYVMRNREVFNRRLSTGSLVAWPSFMANMPSILCAPLVAQDKLIGTLWAGTRADFAESATEFLATIGDVGANAIYRETLHGQTELRLQRSAALRSIDMTISSSMDLKFTLNVLLSQVVSQLGVDAAAVLLFDQATRMLKYAASFGFRTDAISRSQVYLGQGQAGVAALERQVVNIPSLADVGEAFTRTKLLVGEGFISYYAVPLIAKGQVNGVLEIYLRKQHQPDAEWSDFLDALAMQASIAINNTELFENLQRTNYELTFAYDETLEGWVRALDLRDKETEGHTHRVTEMMQQMAAVMGIQEDDMVHARRGALLHDIGKMGVPDNILKKPGSLDTDEWSIMRKHTEYAYQLLFPIRYLQQSIEIPYCHHERWDGTGYPRGLSGENIPVAARIFAVIDVWDALLSDRAYRPAWKRADAISYIRSQSGKQFDPAVVTAFLSIVENGYDFQNYPDVISGSLGAITTGTGQK